MRAIRARMNRNPSQIRAKSNRNPTRIKSKSSRNPSQNQARAKSDQTRIQAKSSRSRNPAEIQAKSSRKPKPSREPRAESRKPSPEAEAGAWRQVGVHRSPPGTAWWGPWGPCRGAPEGEESQKRAHETMSSEESCKNSSLGSSYRATKVGFRVRAIGFMHRDWGKHSGRS